jgi:hypothetical protein
VPVVVEMVGTDLQEKQLLSGLAKTQFLCAQPGNMSMLRLRVNYIFIIYLYCDITEMNNYILSLR